VDAVAAEHEGARAAGLPATALAHFDDAAPAFVSALKSEDLPTLGRPTIPQWRVMEGCSGGQE